MTISILTPDAYRRAVSLRDLTCPAQGPHAMQQLVDDIRDALTTAWGADAIVRRSNPVATIEDNYDRLHYPPEGVARDARYTRYVSDQLVLRSQTTAAIPPLLDELATAPPRDVLLVCPGMCYRRDAIDRLHTGEPHQVDLWRIRTGAPLTTGDLREMIALVVEAALPGAPHRVVSATHPYTTDGLQIDARVDGAWVEIGECGLALPALIAEAGMSSSETTGLAMGLGLDRLLMLRKGIDDIRLLRSADPRVADQMLDLLPYHRVSSQPATRRDLSLVVADGTTVEDLGDRVRDALGDDADCVEAVELVAVTRHADLPPQAVERLGIAPGQVNALLRVVLRHVDRTLTDAESNRLRNDIYAALHEGARTEWATDGGSSGAHPPT